MMSVSARTQKVKMNYYWNLGMQATQTKMIQRTAKVKSKPLSKKSRLLEVALF